MHVNVGLVIVFAGIGVTILIYGRAEFRRNVVDLQDKARAAREDISSSLQAELALRDIEIERLKATNAAQAAQILALQEVVAQGTKVEGLIGAVNTLRKDVLGRFDQLKPTS
jgi:hypothetical protein